MSKRRGMSAEEKNQAMLSIFTETQSVYSMKELEKIGNKQKGVVAQAVEGVVRGLADDGLIINDRIGSGSYFWAFASDAANRRAVRTTQLEAEVAELEARLAAEAAKHGKLEEDRSAEDRDALLEELKTIRAEEAALQAQVQSMADNDPALYHATLEDLREATDAANRWADNIFTVRDYTLSVNSSVTEGDFNKHFGVDPAMDYLE